MAEPIPTGRETIESPEAIRELLEGIYEKNILLAHQTDAQGAEKILHDTSYESNGHIEATVIMTSPEQIMSVSSAMAAGVQNEESRKLIHRNSKAIVIFALFNGVVMFAERGAEAFTKYSLVAETLYNCELPFPQECHL